MKLNCLINKNIKPIFQRIPCLPEEILSRTGFFILSIENREMYISLALLISVLVPEVLFFVLSIFWHLFNIKSQSRATNRLQKQLFFAMCLQVYIPFMVVTIPAAYCISSIVFGHYNQGSWKFKLKILKCLVFTSGLINQ